MQLTKHHGLGNDFLVVLDLDEVTPIDAGSARALCDRHRGIGADGVLRVTSSSGEADVAMTLRNADGSLAEMSGNGIRCLAQAVARAAGTETIELAVATDGGLRRVAVRPGPDARTSWVEVDMRPARASAGPGTAPSISVPHTESAVVDMGNPHLVLLVDDPAAVDLAALGPELSRQFRRGTNVEAVALAARPHTVELRVWERGAGLTQACGTGACAAAFAAHQWGLVGDRVTVDMPGGSLEVMLGDTVVLGGPAVFVADVSVPDSLLAGESVAGESMSAQSVLGDVARRRPPDRQAGASRPA